MTEREEVFSILSRSIQDTIKASDKFVNETFNVKKYRAKLPIKKLVGEYELSAILSDENERSPEEIKADFCNFIDEICDANPTVNFKVEYGSWDSSDVLHAYFEDGKVEEHIGVTIDRLKKYIREYLRDKNDYKNI